MSLPREWSLQDPRGSMYSSGGSTGEFATSTEQATSTIDRIFTESLSIHHQKTSVKQSEDINLSFTEFNAVGSLFSIHSAPPVPSVDLGITDNSTIFKYINSNTGIIGGTESPKRPASLAIDQSYKNLSTGKIINGIGQQQQQQQGSELEEDDNENLLTVSSLTARPLIAKSHEIRSNKHVKKHRRRKQKREKNPTSNEQHHQQQQPLDGGYGWIVVFGAFSVQFWVAGLVKSYGVLFVEILETFPSSSTTVASWIPAILSALCLALAPLSSALCQRFSCRIVVFIGGLFCAFGLILSYFATSLYHLLFTFGILTGIGGGLSTTPGIIIVSYYFDKHRALANGICVSGTAAGSFVFPLLIEHLVQQFGFHGTILVLGGCMLHVCASSALYRPIIIEENVPESIHTFDISSRHSSSNGAINTTTTYIDSADGSINKKNIEHIFLEESRNRINDFYNTNKFVNNHEKSLTTAIPVVDSEDEDKDIVCETRFLKPIKSVRSTGLLHSVEDLSTDSTCVYKSRSGFDSNRGSKRRNNKNSSTSIEDIIFKIPEIKTTGTLPITTNRGLSKSMIIPTPVSDFSVIVNEDKLEQTCCDKIKRYLDITLLKDPKFIAMCLSVTLMSTGCPYMLYFLPAYAISAGYTKSEAGFLVAVSAILDLIGRLVFGYLSDLHLFDRRKAYIICIVGAGLAVLLIPSATSWYIIGCASATYGLCLGCWYLLMPVLLSDLFGTDRISSSYGLVRMFQSVGAISVPPLAGFLRDLTEGYEICFYCMGTCMVLGSIPILISCSIFESTGRNDDGDEDDDDDDDADDDDDDDDNDNKIAVSKKNIR